MSRNFSNIAVVTNLSSSITSSATSLTVNSSTGYPSAPFAIRIEDEVILVGTKSGTTFSDLTRGFDGTTAAVHTTAPDVEHVVIAADIRDSINDPDGSVPVWSPILDHKPSTDTPDDDFDLPTLDAKWTVVSGSPGTVSFLETGNVAKYDLAARSGYLLTQAGNNGSQTVSLRQDYTIPDGGSVVTVLAVPGLINTDPGWTHDSVQATIGVNNNDTTYVSGTYMWFGVQATGSAGLRLVAYNGTTAEGTGGFNTGAMSVELTQRVYLRIARSGTTYYPAFSFDGTTWNVVGQGYALGSTMDNLWVTHANAAAVSNATVPIVAWDWIRQGTNNLDPWQITNQLPAGQSNLLGETSLSASASYIEVTNIPSTYRDLKIVARLRGDTAAQGVDVNLRVGGTAVDTGSNYRYGRVWDGSSEGNSASESAALILMGSAPANTADAGNFGTFIIHAFDYADPSFNRFFSWEGSQYQDTNYFVEDGWGRWSNTTDSIGTIRLYPASGNFVAGSKIWVYGEPVLGGGTGLVKGNTVQGDLYVTGTLFEGQDGGTDLYAAGGGSDIGLPEWIRYLSHRLDDETVHADDDFFLDGTVGGTAITPTGTATWTESRDLLSVKTDSVAASDAAVRAFTLTPTTTPVTVETSMRLLLTGGNAYAGICFTDGTASSSNFAGCGIQLFGGAIYLKQNGGTVTNIAITNTNVDIVENGGPQNRLYLRCVWTAANTFENAWSLDGVSWSDFGGGSFSVTMTPTHFGPYLNNQGSTADNLASFDYLRINESDLSA